MLIKWLLPVYLLFYSLLHSKKTIPDETHHVFQPENEYVRVWKTVIMPHQLLKMH
jgi:hypothetical protein